MNSATDQRRIPDPDQGLWLALLSGMTALFAFVLLALPQQVAQRPAQRGVMVIHLAPDGNLRLWNRPIAPQQLPALLREAARRHPGTRLRLVPAPATSWQLVQRFIPLLEVSALPFEVQLPAPGQAL
jgi:hypothetical protein